MQWTAHMSAHLDLPTGPNANRIQQNYENSSTIMNVIRFKEKQVIITQTHLRTGWAVEAAVCDFTAGIEKI